MVLAFVAFPCAGCCEQEYGVILAEIPVCPRFDLNDERIMKYVVNVLILMRMTYCRGSNFREKDLANQITRFQPNEHRRAERRARPKK